MTSVDESVDEKTDTSVLRRSTREKRARFEPAEVKEESEDSDEQGNENEVAVGKMEEDEKPKDSQDSLVRPGSLGMVNRSFMIMEEGKVRQRSERGGPSFESLAHLIPFCLFFRTACESERRRLHC